MIVSAVARPTGRARPELLAPTLGGGARVEICILGSGLAGMVAAYLLARERHAVMVVDEGPIGGAGPASDLAHLSSALEHSFCELERRHGAKGAQLAARGHAAAIEALEAIVRRERIACDYERLDGYRFLPRESALAEAHAEAAAALRAGVRGVEVLPGAPIDGAESGPCVRYPGQAQFHCHKLLSSLARCIRRDGGRIHYGVRVRSVQPGRPSTIVTTGGHRIQADVIVRPGGIDPGVRPANVVGLRMARGALTRALYWDDRESLRCARLGASGPWGEMLLVSGEEPPEALEQWARNHFPRAGEVLLRSSGEAPVASDLFALVGRDEGVYAGTASWGSALSRAVIGGIAIHDFASDARPRPDSGFGAHFAPRLS